MSVRVYEFLFEHYGSCKKFWESDFQGLFYDHVVLLQMTVTASDSGVTPMNSSASVLIDVTSSSGNTSAPVFSQSDYSVTISSSSPTGSPVTTVTATTRSVCLPFCFESLTKFLTFHYTAFGVYETD